jgi:hypothetical protein
MGCKLLTMLLLISTPTTFPPSPTRSTTLKVNSGPAPKIHDMFSRFWGEKVEQGSSKAVSVREIAELVVLGHGPARGVVVIRQWRYRIHEARGIITTLIVHATSR